jgi:hypothetical protein
MQVIAAYCADAGRVWYTLQEYVSLQYPALVLETRYDTCQYTALLDHTLIVPSISAAAAAVVEGDVLTRAIHTLLSDKSSWSNLLAKGYALTSGNRLVCTLPTRAHQLFSLPEWVCLFERLGVHRAVDLLVNCAVFVQTRQGHGMWQLTGVPLQWWKKNTRRKDKERGIDRAGMFYKANKSKIVCGVNEARMVYCL